MSTGGSTSRIRPFGGMILSEPPGLIRTYFSPIRPLVLIEAIESSWSFTPGWIDHDHVGLVVLQHDAIHAAHLDARDLDGGAGLEPAHGGEIRADDVAAAAQEIDPAELHGQPSQGDQADEHEHAHAQIQCRSFHRPFSSDYRSVLRGHRLDVALDELLHDRVRRAGSPRAGRPRRSAPSWSIATRSAISKISGISWLTMTAVNRNLRCSSTIRWWIVLTRIGSSPVVGSSKKTISGSVTRARAMATRLRMPPEISAGYLCAHAAEPDLVERLLDARGGSRARERRLLPEREGDVLEHGHGVEEGAALEHDPVALADPVERAAPRGG